MRFLNMGKEISLKKGDVIVEPGAEDEQKIYYLIEGDAVLAISSMGKSLYEENLKKGDLFGIVSPFVDKKPVESVVASSDVKLYVWDKLQFTDAIGVYQELAKMAIVTLSKRLRNLNSILAD